MVQIFVFHVKLSICLFVEHANLHFSGGSTAPPCPPEDLRPCVTRPLFVIDKGQIVMISIHSISTHQSHFQLTIDNLLSASATTDPYRPPPPLTILSSHHNPNQNLNPTIIFSSSSIISDSSKLVSCPYIHQQHLSKNPSQKDSFFCSTQIHCLLSLFIARRLVSMNFQSERRQGLLEINKRITQNLRRSLKIKLIKYKNIRKVIRNIQTFIRN